MWQILCPDPVEINRTHYKTILMRRGDAWNAPSFNVGLGGGRRASKTSRKRCEPSPVYFHQELHPCLPTEGALPHPSRNRTDSTLKRGASERSTVPCPHVRASPVYFHRVRTGQATAPRAHDRPMSRSRERLSGDDLEGRSRETLSQDGLWRRSPELFAETFPPPSLSPSAP